MNRRSDSSSGCRRGVAQRFKLPISASQFAKSRHIKLAVALVFCSGASLLYAQEQSAAVISHEVKEIFERAGKAVLRFMVSTSTAQFAAPDFSLILPARFTPPTQ